VCPAQQHTRNSQYDNYHKDGHWKGPYRRPVSDWAPPHDCVVQDTTHYIMPHCLICTLPTHIFPIQADDEYDGRGGGRGVLRGWPAPHVIPTPAVSVVSVTFNRCADCKSLIRLSPRISIKDPRPQTKAIRNLESAARPHRNATLKI